MKGASARLREELFWAEKHIDRPKNRDRMIERANRIRDRFNAEAYDSGLSEVVFEVPSSKKGFTPLAKVEVLPFDDGKWTIATHGNLSTTGFGNGFWYRTLYPDKRSASVAGVKRIIEWTLQYYENENETQANRNDAARVFKAAVEFLLKPKQASLF